MIIQFLCNSKGPARFFSVPRASKVYHRRRSRLPEDQRSTTESTEIHGKENPNQLPLSVSVPGATPARKVGPFRGYPFVMIFLAGVIFSPIMRPPSYRQRLFVEYDLGGSSGSAALAAHRAGYPWPEQMARKMLRNVEKRGVQAARNAPSEDRKCWQRIELGIHGLKSWGMVQTQVTAQGWLRASAH